MSNSSGPSTCRRSARSKNVFESSESFCSGPYGSKNIVSSAGQLPCPADSGSLLENSPDKVKRKKRRKSVSELELDNRYKITKRRAIEPDNLQRSYEELIKVKLKDSRIPIVLLNRLDDDHSQPKLAAEEKVEQRIQLPGLTLPAKVDPKILKYDVVVKINKRQTESLIEVSKRRLQRQASTSDTDERRERESAGSVADSDFNKCAERLTDKLESFSSDDNKCSKNQLVSNNSRRHARASVDKSNNNRLPARLREANSRFSLSSITENSISEIHLESSKSSKSFVHNNRRLKRNSLDQINEKNCASLLETKQKCIVNTPEENGQTHSESSSKDDKKYSKISVKDVRKHPRNVTDISDQKCVESSVDIDEKIVLSSLNETAEKQNDIACEKNRIPKRIVQSNLKRTRNFSNKNIDRHLGDSEKIDNSKPSPEQNNEQISEKSDKDIKDAFKSQTENQKIVVQKVGDNNDVIGQNAIEISNSHTEKFVEEHNRRLSKRINKFSEYVHNETENNKKITRRHDDKNDDRRSDNIIENRMNFIENFVENTDLIENFENSTKQTDSIKRSTRSMSDKNDKNIDNAQDNHLERTQSFKESIKIKSQNVDINIQKCSKNIKENNRRLNRNTDKSLHLVEEINKNHSKNFDDKVKKVSKKSMSQCIEENNDLPKNLDRVENVSNSNIQSSLENKNEKVSKKIIESAEQYSEKSLESYSKKFHEKFNKILKIPIEDTKLLQKSIPNTSNEKLSGTLTTNFNTIQSSVKEQITKHLDTNAQNNTVSKNIIEKNKRPRRKLIVKNNDNNTPLNTEDSIEKHNERLTENLNKNINECSKTQVEIITKRTTRLSDKRTDHFENPTHQKLDEHSNNKNSEKINEEINISSTGASITQTEIIKKIRRKTSLDKNEKTSQNLKNDHLDLTQSCVEKNSETSEELPTNCVKDYPKNENDNKMVTRNSSYCKQDKHTQKIQENNTNLVQDIVKEKDKSSKELNNSLKHFRKMSKEESKSTVINLSPDQNNTNSTNSLQNNLNSITISCEDNKKELPKKSDKNFKDNLQIQNKNKIITRQSSHHEHEKRTVNSIETHLIRNPVQKSNKEHLKELDENLKESTIISTEDKVIAKKSSEKIEKQSENRTNSNFDPLPNSIMLEKKDLLKNSQKNVKTDLKIQAENQIVTRNSSIYKNEKHVENSVKGKTNDEENDVKRKEKKLPEETQKHIKDCSKIPSEQKMATRNLSSLKNEGQADNVIKIKSNVVQNDLDKNEENVPEKLQESILENKVVVKNTSSNKVCNNLIKDTSICVQNGIHNDDEMFPDGLCRNIKKCPISQVESHITALKKSSSDKSTEKLIENKSDCINNTNDRNQEKPTEELDKVIKDCSKSQIENNKRVTRKSSSDKHERHIEDSITSHSVVTQNCLEKNEEKVITEYEKKCENLNTNNIKSSQNSININNEIEQINNKENSKIETEINERMTRSTLLEKEIPSDNLIENIIDCAQILVEDNENKNLENLINNTTVSFNNIVDDKNINKQSEIIIDFHIQNILEDSENISSTHLFDENSEKNLLCSDENCINNSKKDFTENIIVKEKSENIIESNSKNAQDITISTDEKDTTVSKEYNKNMDDESPVQTSFNNVLKNITSTSNSIEIEVPKSNEIQDQSTNSETNFKESSESLINSEIIGLKETLSQDENILNNVNDLIEINDTCIKFSVDTDIEEQCNKNVDKDFKDPIENNITKVENLTSEKYEDLPEQFFKKIDDNILTFENNEAVFNNLEEIKEKSSEIISQLSFQEEENQCEEFFDALSSSSFENATLEISNDHSITFEETCKLPVKSNDIINNFLENHVDNGYEIVNKSLVIDDTKAQEDSIEDITEIRAEDLDESIRNSSRILTENSTMTSCLSFDKNNEIFVENLNSDYNASSVENLVNKIYVNDSQTLKDRIKNKIMNSMEKNGLGNNAVNNKTDKLLFENILKSDLKLDDNITEQNINITENTNSIKVSHNSDFKPENIKTVVQSTDINSETVTALKLKAIENQSVIDEDALAKERRKITLLELKKKCTENLGNRQAMSLESSRQEALKTLPIISMNDSTKDSPKNCNQSSTEDSALDSTLEIQKSSSENSFENFDSNENLANRLMHLKSFGYLNQSIDSVSRKEDQCQVKNMELNYSRSLNLDQNMDFSCKNCDENFDSNRELKRHDKIKHRQRLVLKITKTNTNKHVTHMVEPVLNQKDDHFDHLNNENTINENDTSMAIDDEQKTKHTEQKQDYYITEGDIKIIVKKESGSKNSHVVKEIKITPKSGEYGSGYSDVSSFATSNCSPAPSEIVQPVKRQRGRPRKYPIFTGTELLEKQLTAATNLNSTIKSQKIPEAKPTINEPPVQPVESIVKPDNLLDNYKTGTVDSKISEKVKWTESEDSKWAKILGVKRKRRRTRSLECYKESDDILPAAKKLRSHEDGDRGVLEAINEADYSMKYKITKELVVRLTKLDSVPKISKEFNVNINNVECNVDNDDSATKAEDKQRANTRSTSDNLEDGSFEPTKTVKNLSLESNNNNINDIEKCLTAPGSSSNIIQKTPNVTPEAGSSKASTEVNQTASLTEEGQESQRSTKQRADTNAPEMTTKAQLVVTPRRQTIDRTEADESQKAKLLMLMNATTPYEAASKMNTTVVESPQKLQPQPSTMQLQPQQFCILFIPDGLYTSESANNKDITPTATIVNFQPVPDAEMANRSLIYTPTTPTKISVDDQTRSYVCGTCTEVLDLIGRLEASLGMTEEDKSAIKCPYCSNHFQSLYYLEYHLMQEHLKCENEKQCKHSHFNSLRIPSHEAASEFEIYITFALKCRSCYDIFSTVLQLNDHVMHKHKTLVRLRPSLGPAAIEAVCSAYPSYARKNGTRNSAPSFQCPSDCVCRIGIRSSDTPQQRQQMLKRCPHVMRRLEKIESAAYEVYTCTLCKSTFLMKDEVVDHLMKMHEVSCKFPCYTCLTSFRSLQMQENHRCSETTLHDLDKILSIAILPTNVGGKDNNKYLEREDSSTDEYGAVKTSSNESPLIPPSPLRNGFKRKNNGTCIAALEQLLIASKAENPRLIGGLNLVCSKKRKRCPKCKKRFVYRKSFHDHIIYEHILKGNGLEGPKKFAVELLKLVNEGKANGPRALELSKLLSGHTDDDGTPLKDLTMMDEQENWEEVSTTGNELINEKDLMKCTRCKKRYKSSVNSGNLAGLKKHHLPSFKSRKIGLCDSCENSGPKTRRQQLQMIHPFACKKCTDTFPTSIELKCHKRAVHSKKPVDDDFLHTCNICKKTFALVHLLDKHKKIHHQSILGGSAKPDEEEDEEDTSHNPDSTLDSSKDTETNHSLDKANTSVRRDSSDSSSAGSKEPEEQPLNCSFCEEVCSSKVSLKNHLKREHGRRASICQFCNGLLIDTSEVRHMLDYHIVPSKSNPRHSTEIKIGTGGPWSRDEAGRMRDDVEELVRILGKHRLQSLMMYHDFEGKCNNAIMRCPICPELFATRESCRFHYVWIHDDNCLLCDETFRSGSSACQHKVSAHTSTASYLWCIQRLVTAIVGTLRLDPNQPSHVLYQILATKLEEEERTATELESTVTRCPSEKGSNEETATVTERFLEEVLSEDQLPDSSNIIEVVIGKEDSEDDLLSMLNLSPNYESCEQHRLPNAGVAPPEEDDDEETIAAGNAVPTTPPATSATTMATTGAMAAATTSPVFDSYVTSGVCKYRLENDEEQLVLVVTDEDLVTFKDDIGSLAERISATCDSLTLEEITEMLRAYFENMSIHVSGSSGA